MRGVRTELEAMGHAGLSVAQAIQQERQRTEEERARGQELRKEVERRMEELSLRHVELRHLKADLAVKEAFIAELRQAASEKQTVVAEEKAAAEADLGRLRKTVHELQVFINSPGMQTAAGVARRLSHYPRTYRLLQRVVRRVAGKPPEP
jgi:DNA repair exonuclease SbcCD ATPase subunit